MAAVVTTAAGGAEFHAPASRICGRGLYTVLLGLVAGGDMGADADSACDDDDE